MIEKRKAVCVDTSYFMSVGPLPGDIETLVTPSVEEEMEKYGVRPENCTVMMPSRESVSRVTEVARSTGDMERLSPADVEIIALALELKCPLATDDYALQNVAAVLGVEVITGTQRGIRAVVRWKYRCVGCGRYYRKNHGECPVCGSRLRAVPASTRPLSSSRE